MKQTFCTIPFDQITTFNDNHYHHCYAAIPTDADLTDFARFAVKKEDGSPFDLRETSFIDVWNSEWYKQLRLDLINGIQNPVCQHCWDREKVGAWSPRMKEITGMQSIEQEIKNMNPDGSLNIGPRYLEIRTGNFCNLKCIACHPVHSTEIVKEVKQWRTMLVEIPKHVNMSDRSLEDFDKSFNKNHILTGIHDIINGVEEIQFYGGEPLVTHEVALFLDDLIKLGRSQFLKIKLITNLTITNQKIFDKLDSFKEVELVVSWDHVDPIKSHYIRYPQNYERFLANFQRILHHPVYKIKLSPTISIFNIYDIPDIFDEFEKLSHSTNKAIPISSNILEIPRYFSIQYLKDNQKHEILTMLDQYLVQNKFYKIFDNGNSSAYNNLLRLKNLMIQHPIDYSEIVAERTRVLELYDQTRSTNSKQLFPYLYE
jgi:MoaA/NifB/PqqE/SkfB family radical SAM enzyme